MIYRWLNRRWYWRFRNVRISSFSTWIVSFSSRLQWSIERLCNYGWETKRQRTRIISSFAKQIHYDMCNRWLASERMIWLTLLFRFQSNKMIDLSISHHFVFNFETIFSVFEFRESNRRFRICRIRKCSKRIVLSNIENRRSQYFNRIVMFCNTTFSIAINISIANTFCLIDCVCAIRYVSVNIQKYLLMFTINRYISKNNSELT